MAPRRSFLILLVLLLLFSLCGCVVHPNFYSAREDVEQETNPVLWKKVADLEKQNQVRKEADAALISKMSSFQTSLSKTDMSLQVMEGQLLQLNAGLENGNSTAQQGDGSTGRETANEVGVSMKAAGSTTGTAAPMKKGVVATLKDETADFQQRLKKLEEESRKAQNNIEKTKVSKTMPSIVVVSGTGKGVSAKKMALRLSKLGYRVDRIAQTPQTGYNKNVVFYTEPNRETAARIASRIGGKTIVKPMDWQSKYDIAVISVIK